MAGRGASTVKRLLFGGHGFSQPAPEVGLLLLRVFAGLSLAFAHGRGKLPPSEQFVGMVEGMGVPLPLVGAWAAGLAEFFGGLLLAVGLLTRPAALLITINMAVAGFVFHASDDYGTRELALLYLAIALAFLLKGAGRVSVDRFVRRH